MKPNIKQLQAMVDDWNARFPVGTEVKMIKDSGDIVRTKTRSNAAVMGGHSAVIWLDGVAGCYLLKRVWAV